MENTDQNDDDKCISNTELAKDKLNRLESDLRVRFPEPQ